MNNFDESILFISISIIILNILYYVLKRYLSTDREKITYKKRIESIDFYKTFVIVLQSSLLVSIFMYCRYMNVGRHPDFKWFHILLPISVIISCFMYDIYHISMDDKMDMSNLISEKEVKTYERNKNIDDVLK